MQNGAILNSFLNPSLQWVIFYHWVLNHIHNSTFYYLFLQVIIFTAWNHFTYIIYRLSFLYHQTISSLWHSSCTTPHFTLLQPTWLQAISLHIIFPISTISLFCCSYHFVLSTITYFSYLPHQLLYNWSLSIPCPTFPTFIPLNITQSLQSLPPIYISVPCSPPNPFTLFKHLKHLFFCLHSHLLISHLKSLPWHLVTTVARNQFCCYLSLYLNLSYYRVDLLNWMSS